MMHLVIWEQPSSLRIWCPMHFPDWLLIALAPDLVMHYAWLFGQQQDYFTHLRLHHYSSGFVVSHWDWEKPVTGQQHLNSPVNGFHPMSDLQHPEYLIVV